MKTQGINTKLTGLWAVGLSVALGVSVADARPGERGAGDRDRPQAKEADEGEDAGLGNRGDAEVVDAELFVGTTGA